MRKRKPSGRKGSRIRNITFTTTTEHTVPRSDVKAEWDSLMSYELESAAADKAQGAPYDATKALRSMKFDVFLDKYFTQAEWDEQDYTKTDILTLFFDNCFWSYYDDARREG